MNMVFIAGMLFSCILMITFLSYLYFKQKRLYNASSKVFGALLIFILLCVIIDFHTCIPEINQKIKTYAYTFTVYFLYIISTLLSLATIVIYCFINTCNRFRYKSELIITCLSIPFFYSLVKLVYFISTKNFITMQGEFPAMTYDTFNLIVFDYVVYGIMIIFMAVVMKKGKRTIGEILVNILLIAECIIAISYARRTGTFLASIFLAFNICILYATIQSPKNCVDQRLKCFDSKALDIMFQEYAARKKNYYMFTINIVNYRYYQVKYNLDFAEKLLQTLRNKMPKDSDKTTTFKYNYDSLS